MQESKQILEMNTVIQIPFLHLYGEMETKSEDLKKLGWAEEGGLRSFTSSPCVPSFTRGITFRSIFRIPGKRGGKGVDCLAWVWTVERLGESPSDTSVTARADFAVEKIPNYLPLRKT